MLSRPTNFIKVTVISLSPFINTRSIQAWTLSQFICDCPDSIYKWPLPSLRVVPMRQVQVGRSALNIVSMAWTSQAATNCGQFISNQHLNDHRLKIGSVQPQRRHMNRLRGRNA